MKNIPPLLILFIVTTTSLLAIPMERDHIDPRTRNAATDANEGAHEREASESNVDEEARSTAATATDPTMQQAAWATLSIGRLDEFIAARTQWNLTAEENFFDAAVKSLSNKAQHSATIACYAERELQSTLARADYDQADIKVGAVIAAWKEAATVFENGLATASGESKKLWCKDLAMIEQLTMSAEALRTKIAAERAEALVKATTLINDQPYHEVLPLLIERTDNATKAWEQVAEAFQMSHDKAFAPFQPWWNNQLEEIKNSATIFKINKLYWQTKKNELAAHETTADIASLSHEAAIPVFSSAVTATEKVFKNWSQITRDYQRGLEQAPERFRSYLKTQLEKATLEKDRWSSTLAETKLQQKTNQANYEREILSLLQDHNNLFSAAVETANTAYKEAQTLNKKSKIEALPRWQEAITKIEEALEVCSLFVEQGTQPLQHLSENFKKVQSQMLQTAEQQKSELGKLLKQSKTNCALSIDTQKQKQAAELQAHNQALADQLKPFQTEITKLQKENERIEKRTIAYLAEITKKMNSNDNDFLEIKCLWTKADASSETSAEILNHVISVCNEALQLASITAQPFSFYEKQRSLAENKLFFLEVSRLSNEASKQASKVKQSILAATSVESPTVEALTAATEGISAHLTQLDRLHGLWSQVVKGTEATSSAWRAAATAAALRPSHFNLEEDKSLQRQFEDASNNCNAWSAKKISMKINLCKTERNKIIFQAKQASDITQALLLWDQVFEKHAEGSAIYEAGFTPIDSYIHEVLPRFQFWWREELKRITDHWDRWNKELIALEGVKQEDIFLKSQSYDEAATSRTEAVAPSVVANEEQQEEGHE